MSSDSAKRLKAAPPQRTPLTPRSNASSTFPAPRLSAPRPPTVRPATLSPRPKSHDETQAIVTPRSTMKRSKPGNAPSPDSSVGGGGGVGAGGGIGGALASRPRVGRPKTAASDNASRSPPLSRSPGFMDNGHLAAKDSIESRFFHASDAQRQAPVPRKPEPKKLPTFFYADGKEDISTMPPKPPSPVLSSISEKRSSAPWIKPENHANIPKSPPMLSPSLVATASSPFFASNASPYGQFRSPSPSKENIHLSYRKGASQIFGMRPTPPSTASSTQVNFQLSEQPRQPGSGAFHQKSPSLSSIESGNSHGSRRRSATTLDSAVTASPLTYEVKNATISQERIAASDLPSIDTARMPPAILGSPPQATPLSPTKNPFDVAADARRERKVLDLEISNSSLLAINASLEREMRRQKAELKRFRRLSRAGRFSMVASDTFRRQSIGLDTHGEGDEEEDADNSFGSGITEDLDDSSESEDESLLSAENPPSGAQADREQNRLAKDEKRLRVDLERHKELLTQSQAMNQSLKRCMFATEEMIRDGRKALEYCVRVSDVKLGGRVLTGHDEDDTIEVEDEPTDGNIESAKGLLDVWSSVGRPVGSDRDSGIEVHSAAGGQVDSGRPPATNSAASDTARSSPGLLYNSAP